MNINAIASSITEKVQYVVKEKTGITVDKVPHFEKLFLDVLRSRYKECVLDVLSAGVLNADVEKLLTDVAAGVVASMK